jgi:hypothetical protein
VRLPLVSASKKGVNDKNAEEKKSAEQWTAIASQVRAAEAQDSGLGSGAGHTSLIESPPERKSPESVRLQVVAATTLKVRRGVLRAPMRVCGRRTTHPSEGRGASDSKSPSTERRVLCGGADSAYS